MQNNNKKSIVCLLTNTHLLFVLTTIRIQIVILLKKVLVARTLHFSMSNAPAVLPFHTFLQNTESGRAMFLHQRLKIF